MTLDGRTAVVTGGASGIGRACALRLAAQGAAIVVLDRDGTAAAKVATEIGRARAIAVDLTDLDAIDALDIDADIVVNNAGIQHVAPIEDFPPETFSVMLRLMVEAPFRLVRRSLPGMYARGWGRIVNISSVHGIRASEFKVAYVTAKHALEGLSKVIALEGAAHGVTSNCVNPAYVRTPLVDKQIAAQAEAHGIGPDEVVEKIMLAPAALKRLLEPDEIAAAVAYLCSPEASFVTGSSLMIDGGWSIR
jgi:3-hydroxybutyrate dehydrogenase